MEQQVVVVGAGMAGFHVATALRQRGFAGAITLVGEEAELPYSRPPLSKGLLTGKETENELAFREASFYAEQDIRLSLDRRVVSIYPGMDTVRLSDGSVLGYDYLVLATGARPRTLPVESAPGTALTLRTLDDARRLRSALKHKQSLLVVGGGLIGLEVAAAARTAGSQVCVVEMGERVMARAVAPQTSRFFENLHVRHGVDLVTQTRVVKVEAAGGGQVAHLSDGSTRPFDLLVCGLGVTANDELARAANLQVDDGVVVNECLQCIDVPNVFAIGDCARFAALYAERPLRLESVQNALDQAKAVAASIVSGQPEPYRALPWFWTEQYDTRIQMAGWPHPHDALERIPGNRDDAYSLEYFNRGELVAVECVNDGPSFKKGRKALQARFDAAPQLVA